MKKTFWSISQFLCILSFFNKAGIDHSMSQYLMAPELTSSMTWAYLMAPKLTSSMTWAVSYDYFVRRRVHNEHDAFDPSIDRVRCAVAMYITSRWDWFAFFFSRIFDHVVVVLTG